MVTVTSTIADARGHPVASSAAVTNIGAGGMAGLSQTLTVATPRLWDGLRDPYLYKVWTVVSTNGVVTDVQEEPFGIRFFKVTANDGFYLNGRYMDLHGVSLHQDVLNRGWAVSPADVRQDFAVIHDLGANTVRVIHYQHDQLSYQIADQMGLVVWAELAVIDGISATAAFDQNARQNYNHPSIFFWSLSNELQAHKGPDPVPLMRQLDALAHHEDGTRPTTVALCCLQNAHPMITVSDAVGFNAYFGWYYGSYREIGPWLDAMHRAHPSLKMALSRLGGHYPLRCPLTVSACGSCCASGCFPDQPCRIRIRP
jgi:beta-galactosidase